MDQNSSNDKARWYAYYDKEAKGWKPLFCTPSFSKWTDIKINEEVGEMLYKLRIVQCEEATASAIEKIVVETYANL